MSRTGGGKGGIVQRVICWQRNSVRGGIGGIVRSGESDGIEENGGND